MGKELIFYFSPFQVEHLMLSDLHPSSDQGLPQRCSWRTMHLCWEVLVLARAVGTEPWDGPPVPQECPKPS